MIDKHLIKSFVGNTARMVVIRAILTLIFALFLNSLTYFGLLPEGALLTRIIGLIAIVAYITSFAFIALAIEKYFSKKNMKSLIEDIDKLKKDPTPQ